MGQKVHPFGFRLGYNKNWQSRWFSKKEYPAFVYEDSKIRAFVKKLLYHAGLAKIEIERAGGKVRLILSTARPGIVIGRKGVEIEKLRGDLRQKFGREFSLEVNEIRRPEVDAQLVAENIAQQLERRVAFRRAMKRTVSMARKFGGEGIKVTCAGRLAGAERISPNPRGRGLTSASASCILRKIYRNEVPPHGLLFLRALPHLQRISFGSRLLLRRVHPRQRVPQDPGGEV
jgi:small subunit ribosomal protein S3